jgi:hypothetical protein
MSKIKKLLEETNQLQTQLNEFWGLGKKKDSQDITQDTQQDIPQNTEDQEEYKEPSPNESLLGEVSDYLGGMLSEVRSFMSDVYEYGNTPERFLPIWKDYDKLNYFNSKVEEIKNLLNEYKKSPGGFQKAFGLDELSSSIKLINKVVLVPLESIMVNTEEIKIEHMLITMIRFINDRMGIPRKGDDLEADLDDISASHDSPEKIKSDAMKQRKEVQQIINQLRPGAMKALASRKTPRNLQEAWEQLEKTLR